MFRRRDRAGTPVPGWCCRAPVSFPRFFWSSGASCSAWWTPRRSAGSSSPRANRPDGRRTTRLRYLPSRQGVRKSATGPTRPVVAGVILLAPPPPPPCLFLLWTVPTVDWTKHPDPAPDGPELTPVQKKKKRGKRERHRRVSGTGRLPTRGLRAPFFTGFRRLHPGPANDTPPCFPVHPYQPARFGPPRCPVDRWLGVVALAHPGRLRVRPARTTARAHPAGGLSHVGAFSVWWARELETRCPPDHASSAILLSLPGRHSAGWPALGRSRGRGGPSRHPLFLDVMQGPLPTSPTWPR